MTHKTTPTGRKPKLPVVLVAAALLGTTTYSLQIFSERSANAAGNLPKVFVNKAPAAGFADLVERVQPAVVSVRVKGGAAGTTNRRFPRGHGMEEFFRQFENRSDRRRFRTPWNRGVSQGSGFVVSEDGFVVTNNHVVANGGKIVLKFADGDEHEAKLIGADAKTDLALLKIKSKGKSFPFVEFTRNAARVGDWVVAVGNPFGLGGTVTTGIVSARGRDIGSGPFDDFLQIDAAINRGSSGGPAFNMKGEVVGVNTAIFSPSGGNVGIGFAIPAELADKIVSDLKDDGIVTRGWLGVAIQPVSDDIAENLGLEKDGGAIVTEVQANSPAGKADLRSGDAILSLNGGKVENPRDLARKVAEIKPGQTPTLELMRDGKRLVKSVTITALPGDGTAGVGGEGELSLAALGLELSPTKGKGVAVVDVDPKSPAADKGLRPGDRILEVSGIEVDDPQSVVGAIERADRNGRKSILILVRSSEKRRFVALPLKRV